MKLDSASAEAVARITQTVKDFADSTVFDIRQGLNEAIKDLRPNQLTAVLEAGGEEWMLALLESNYPSGSRDFVNLVSARVRDGEFTGDVVKLFGGVVPRLCESREEDAAKLMRFVSLITRSTAFSAAQKDLIIWGTHDANPTLAVDGHWANAAKHENYFAQAAILSGIVLGAEGDATAAVRLLPPDVARHVQTLDGQFNDLPGGDLARMVFLSPVRDYLKESACCAIS